jgi:Domain of unknown function (DUF4114)
MADINLVPSTVDLLTSTDIKVANVVSIPAITIDSITNIALSPSPLVSLLTSTDPKVADVVPVPAVTIDSIVESIILAPSDLVASAVNTTILPIDSIGLLGITDLSLIADSTAPAVLVTPPVLVTAPNVLDVVNLDSVEIGSKSQGLAQGHTFDLSDYTGKALKADITTTSSADYTNSIGFYVVEDAIGTIKLADGSTLKPGDVNYAVEAIKNALTNSLQTAQADTKLGQDLVGGRIYAPVVIAQGSLTDFVSKNPSNSGGANDIHAYFNYIGANSDNTDHFKLLGNNTFGVEDMYSGGDLDFNDLVVNMNIKTA